MSWVCLPLLLVGSYLAVWPHTRRSAQWARLAAVVALITAAAFLSRPPHPDAKWLATDLSFVGGMISLVVGWFLCVLWTDPDSIGREAKSLGLILLSVAGTVSVAAATDTVTLWISVEATLWPWRISISDRKQNVVSSSLVEGAWQVGVLASVGAGLGLLLITVLTGETELVRIRTQLLAAYDAQRTTFLGGISGLGTAAVALIFAGWGWSLGALPVPWLGVQMARRSTPSELAWMLTLPRWSALLALTRVFINLTGYEEAIRLACLLSGTLTVLIQGVGLAVERNLGGWVWRLATMHVGLVLIAWAIGFTENALNAPVSAPPGLAGGMALSFGLFAIALLIVLGLCGLWISLADTPRPLTDRHDFAGLIRTHPWTAVGLAVLLGLASGLPPGLGFWSRWLLAANCLTIGAADGAAGNLAAYAWAAIVVILGIVGSVLGAARFAVSMLFDSPAGRFGAVRIGPLIHGLFVLAMIIYMGLRPTVFFWFWDRIEFF